MSATPEKLRDEILKAIKSVISQHAQQHRPGEKYRVTLREEDHEILELQTPEKEFTVIEERIEEILPENLIKLAKEHHAQHHRGGEQFEINMITETGLARGVEEEKGYRKKEAEIEEPVHQEKEIIMGCNCGWQASMTDILGGESVAEKNAKKYSAKKTEKKSEYAGQSGSGSAEYGGQSGGGSTDYKG